MTTNNDKLANVRVTGESDIIRRLDPLVTSKANPPSDWLLEARAEVSSRDELQEIILESKKSGMLKEDIASLLGDKLNESWGGGFNQEANDAALYLLDEHDQLGGGIHLVSKDTGKVVITLGEDDLWDPGMVPREGGGTAQSLTRIRPDLEGAITTYVFDKAREKMVVEALSLKGHQTALLKEEGDPRLLVATRKGRTQIAQDLSRLSPKMVLQGCGGTAGAFLRHLGIVTSLEKSKEPSIEGMLTASSCMNVYDQTTVSLQHNRARALRGVVGQGWVRDLARQIAEAVFNKSSSKPLPLDIKDVNLQEGLWVVPPEAVPLLADQGRTMLPVDGVPFARLTEKRVGTLFIPEQFGVETSELFEKWTTSARLEFKVEIDWDLIECLNVTGLEYQAHIA